MLTLRHSVSEVRAACTANNFAWLRSFGCRIEARGPWWRVWHQDLPEYRALLVLRESAAASARELDGAADDAVRDGIAVYVDEGALPGWGQALAARGYAVTMQSCVRVATTGGRPRGIPPLHLRRIGMAEVGVWTALYAQVFDRPSTVAAAERRRWLDAFGQPGLQHYLYEHEGVVAGLCELCVDDAVAGLYSVGFLEAARSLNLLRHAVQLARDAVRAQGLQLMYFERARQAVRASEATRATSRIVRVFDAWAPVS